MRLMNALEVNGIAMRLVRISSRLFNKKHVKTARIVHSINRVITGVEISPGVKIGKNFLIVHGNGIVIGSGAEIGDNCIIYQQVTLGTGRDSKYNPNGAQDNKYPRIGNDVTIYAGAKIVGGVTIGDNCEIGANAVVTKDIPSNSIVGGIPARVLKSKEPTTL